MDTETMRAGYLWRQGLLLLGLFLLEAALAILAGLLSLRAADQAAGELCKEPSEKAEYADAKQRSWSFYALGLPAAGCGPLACVGGLILAVNYGTAVRWGVIAGFAAILAGLVWVLLKIAPPRLAVLQQGKDKLKQTGEKAFSWLFREGPESGGTREENEKWAFPLFRIGVSLLMPAVMLLMNLICLIFVGAEGESLVNAARRAGDRMAFVQYIVLIALSVLLMAAFFVLWLKVSRTRKMLEPLEKTTPNTPGE